MSVGGAGGSATQPIAATPEPASVAAASTRPTAGSAVVTVMVVTGASVSTRNVRVAGVGSVSPPRTARARKVCDPSGSAEATPEGDVHAANGPSSTAHSNVASETGD